MRRTSGGSRQTEDGFALLAVLGFMLVFALVLTPLAASSRVRALTVDYDYQRTRLDYAAEALNEHFARRLLDDGKWAALVEEEALSSATCIEGNIALSVSVLPSSTLINLNTAEEGLLREGFLRLGLSRQQSEETTAAVIRFRSPGLVDDEKSSDIEAGPKRGPFEDISELHDFGMLRPYPLSALLRVFSVHSGRAIARRGDPPGLSDRYMIETVLFSRDRWGSNAAAFETDSNRKEIARLSRLATDGAPKRPTSGQSCAGMLSLQISEVLRRVFE